MSDEGRAAHGFDLQWQESSQLLCAGGSLCDTKTMSMQPAFERSSKRRKGYPSESRVKCGIRIVHGEKELVEKLGRNDLCPCASLRRFQELLHALGPI